MVLDVRLISFIVRVVVVGRMKITGLFVTLIWNKRESLHVHPITFIKFFLNMIRSFIPAIELDHTEAALLWPITFNFKSPFSNLVREV
ncbi:predicted protein [Sclerotinia sclerotiorum 1980 UF-70]|uniref:Uncharacterized protein n=1 Tax=Sclerotinia sclerotiorum (strain ATCC 18683 / 1980 / Ss-1) TaxID=665079 RepID=A7FA38_SCLS1|nr:predicted protein [Sclerotinia sclerotiorum 1980 UF-70]EDO00599.1 predicted protein [Sclerotinia sclerotiorum 1980 UF-70]